MTLNKEIELLRGDCQWEEWGVGCFPLGPVKVVLLPPVGPGSSEEMTFIDLV